MDKPTLLADIHRTHAELLAAAAGLDDEALLGPAPGMAGWTRKDVLHHVAWWTGHSANVVDSLTAGREPYDRIGDWNLDAHNARVLAEGQAMSPADVRAEEAATLVRVVAAVEAASDAELFEPGRYAWIGGGALADVVVGDTSGHWPEHVPHLAAG